MKCKHTITTTIYRGSGDCNCGAGCNPAAHGSLQYVERCEDCDASREYASNGNHEESSAWEPQRVDTLRYKGRVIRRSWKRIGRSIYEMTTIKVDGRIVPDYFLRAAFHYNVEAAALRDLDYVAPFLVPGFMEAKQ